MGSRALRLKTMDVTDEGEASRGVGHTKENSDLDRTRHHLSFVRKQREGQWEVKEQTNNYILVSFSLEVDEWKKHLFPSHKKPTTCRSLQAPPHHTFYSPHFSLPIFLQHSKPNSHSLSRSDGPTRVRTCLFLTYSSSPFATIPTCDKYICHYFLYYTLPHHSHPYFTRALIRYVCVGIIKL